MEEDVHQALEVMPGLCFAGILNELPERSEGLGLRDPLRDAEEVIRGTGRLREPHAYRPVPRGYGERRKRARDRGPHLALREYGKWSLIPKGLQGLRELISGLHGGALKHALRLRCSLWFCGRTAEPLTGLFLQVTEIELVSYGEDLLPVRSSGREGLEVKAQGHVGLDGGEHLREPDGLELRDERVMELRRAAESEGLCLLRPRRRDLLDIAEGVQDCRSGLGAGALHPRDVVRGVASDRKVVGDELRRDAELINDALPVKDGVLHGVVNPDAVLHELREVLVPRADHDPDILPHSHGGKRADGVVRLDPGLLQDQHAERRRDVADIGKLCGEVRGNRRPRRLVGGIDLVPEAGLALVRRVEDHDLGNSREITEEVADHLRERQDRARGEALAAREPGALRREERPEEE